MKKYIEPVIKVIEVENSELICQSPGVNDEKGNGVQLSKEIFIDDDDDTEDLW